ncbi:TetR/AcrR family transcriptional regulator [Sphingomonas sp. LY54]|uniref:TetR/AcrR family transcriptional regulator n=1 Tax=Sphingomonas sp. LY54 TaxID=3095343 RepID=UPI002D775153|nr:TetR/AcrR family transcriptional regulator [Sphingomonas sp. LY54]WRP29045.1 TetR/AcrR family transcriptional regulator [Sphingomonas sp. LY54]
MGSPPKRRRLKEQRPADIIAAALEVFAAKGFAGARMEEIAARAGLSKGTIYLYFSTKEDLFRAVVQAAVVPNIEAIQATALASDRTFAELVRTLLPRFAELITAIPLGAVLKMVIGESRNFPELARVWHDDVVQRGVGLLSAIIAQAQARGEVRPGDPRIHAFSLIGPMLLGVIWRETFTPVGAAEVDLPAVARQHAETVLEGLMEKAP